MEGLIEWLSFFSFFLRFDLALQDQPAQPFLELIVFKGVATVLFAVGNVLVLTSMYKLGITGTYLGIFYYFIFLLKRNES